MTKIKINEEEIEFLRELTNVGSGNAATALEQLLGTAIDLEMPEVKIITPSQLSALIGSMSMPVMGVKISIVGDIKGNMFFIVPDEDKSYLKALAEIARPGGDRIKSDPDYSAIEEISNIVAGVFLYSIHDFCGLNAYHKVPDSRTDMLISLLDESIASKTKGNSEFIKVENIFQIDGKTKRKITISMIMILSIDTFDVFIRSIKTAREKMLDG